MKPIVKQSNNKTSFTIVELLTVMTIVVILFSLLMPSLAMVRRYAKRVKQNAQFHSIAAGLDLFNDEFDGYPESDEMDTATPAVNYCGAMKLCEAMVGQDLLGVHENSIFRNDGTDGGTPLINLYPEPLDMSVPAHRDNLKARKGPYLPIERITVSAMGELYSDVGPFDACSVVLCDEYPRIRNQKTGRRVGTPVLYYKANVSKTLHDPTKTNESIYNSSDNQKLINLNLPWDPAFNHSMATAGTAPDGSTADPTMFYKDKYGVYDEKITSVARPKNVDSYILISAGFDGLYGTDDDVFNFGD